MDRPESLYRFIKSNRNRAINIFKTNKNKEDDVEERRNYIYNLMKRLLDNKINRLDCYRNSDIQKAIQLYDEIFFGNILRDALYHGKHKVDIIGIVREKRDRKKYGDKKTSPPGSTNFEKLDTKDKKIELIIYKEAFRETFIEEGVIISNSSRCYDRLECILQTIEHELIHILITLYEDKLSEFERTDNWLTMGHGFLFKQLLFNIFHTETVGSYLQFASVDIYNGRHDFIINNAKLKKKVKILDKEGEFIIASEPYKKYGELFIKVTDKGNKIHEVFIGDILLEGNNRPSKRVNTILSPISRK